MRIKIELSRPITNRNADHVVRGRFAGFIDMRKDFIHTYWLNVIIKFTLVNTSIFNMH